MAAERKKLKVAQCEARAWPPAEAAGLREDAGWVDALKQEWAGSSPEMRAHWEALASLCGAARPRQGDNWLQAEDDVQVRCDDPAELIELEANLPPEQRSGPFPEPGTDAYHETLARVAPDEAWLARVRTLLDAGPGRRLAGIYRRAVDSGIGSLNRNGPNKDFLRALIWCVAARPDPELTDALRQLAVWSIDHRTAQAKTIGLALAFAASEPAAAALRVVAGTTKRPAAKARFARYATHVERKLGLSAEASAERFVPTFGLDATGARLVRFGEDGTAELRLDASKVVLRYFNRSGKPVATVPSSVRRNHAGPLQELRTAARALEQLLSSQRDRIESFFLTGTTVEFHTWQERYLDHPVVGTLARRLIWHVDNSAVMYAGDRALDVSGEPKSFAPSARVRLWHPLQQPVGEVQAWRHRVETTGLTQPFKQAHREIYLLTEAERQTSTYSNRFAGHVLRQSRFRALAAGRGWKTPLLGNWDGGDRGIAHRDLPGGWRAEFWLYAGGDDEAEQHFQHRGCLYIATDQVRFHQESPHAPAPLEQVPPMMFSEILREVDLFVGVASVGNDPAWADGGPGGRYRDYWQRFSFGDLTASGKTRQDALQRLVPRLKIAGRCSFQEHFLVVQGDLRAYKIHLGSGNILILPNDQYLCIVPKPGVSDADSLSLPFEGDRMLSVILSKAFLLVNDARITDPGIVNQIRRS